MMRRPATMTAAAVLGSALLTGAVAAAGTGAAATPRAAVLAGTWGTAAEVPGSAALNAGGHASIHSVSCAAAGYCSAGGNYASSANGSLFVTQAFVVSETNGTWGTAAEVPGSAALNAGGSAEIDSVSCPSAGNCSAGGFYTDASGVQQAFIVNQTNATWGTAAEVPGTAALNKRGPGSPGAAIVKVSCAAVGNCSGGGYYTDASGRQQAFVVGETNGTWRTAQEIPGTAALNAGGHAAIESLSCAGLGDCSAGGYYASSSIDGIPTVQAFVVSETSGTWRTAHEVPGTAALNGGGYADIYSVSCASPGNCSAGGAYTNSTPATEAFVISETKGTWGTATEVRGIATLNKRRLAQIGSVSCASPGNCSAGGFYQDASFNNQAFVVGETNGTWGTAQEVPGTAALDQGSPGASLESMSCSAAGNCSAGGSYADASNFQQAFVVTETNGTWGTAAEVPGTATLNAGGNAAAFSISCASAGNCSAGGRYTDGALNTQAFVVNETS